MTLRYKCSYENLFVQYTGNFSSAKIKNFIGKIGDIFNFKNIDCGYILEPPHRGYSNEYLQSIFWSKNKTPFSLNKSGVYGGIHCTDMLS